jgi:hypothetical protein
MKSSIMFLILNLLDCLSTYVALSLGCVEANIFMRSLIDVNSILGYSIKMFLSVLTIIILHLIHKEHLIKILNYCFACVVLFNVFNCLIMLILGLIFWAILNFKVI